MKTSLDFGGGAIFVREKISEALMRERNVLRFEDF
jgi:hypothetical protein